ncbi:hypothetical protein R3P38DRAFT_3245734 [Favolaschia claudopus]|uniref:Uncharacterized protein n=1 Tax=Favolaschia claudopus TaxID=2862362 RepID=A0AAV9YZZ2_9AGAR
MLLTEQTTSYEEVLTELRLDLESRSNIPRADWVNIAFGVLDCDAAFRTAFRSASGSNGDWDSFANFVLDFHQLKKIKENEDSVPPNAEPIHPKDQEKDDDCPPPYDGPKRNPSSESPGGADNKPAKGFFQRFREDHPVAATAAAAGLIVGTVPLLAPIALVGALNAVGFGAAGVFTVTTLPPALTAGATVLGVLGATQLLLAGKDSDDKSSSGDSASASEARSDDAGQGA